MAGQARPPVLLQHYRQVIFCVRGVISPLLANIYLQYVFDQWIDAWRKRWAKGEVIVVRYADDLVLGFEHREDAEHCIRQSNC